MIEMHELKYKYLGTSAVSHLLSCVCFTSNWRREIRNVCNLFLGVEYRYKKPTLNLKLNLTESRSPNSSGSIVNRLWAGSPTICSLTPGQQCSLGVKLTIHLCLLPTLRTEGARPPFPHIPP